MHARLKSGMRHFALLTALALAGCSSNAHVQHDNAAMLIGLGIAAGLMSEAQPLPAPELAPSRRVNEQDCTKPIQDWSANLKCR
jgi:uncharacterized protein YcfL